MSLAAGGKRESLRERLGRFKHLSFGLADSTRWYVFKSRRFYRDLERDYGITDARPLEFLSWRLGCNYFAGFSRALNEKVFIKTGGWLRLAGREARALELVHKQNSPGDLHFPKLIAHRDYGYCSFVATEYIEGRRLDEALAHKEIVDLAAKRSLLIQMIEIVRTLHDAGIVHRDIRPENLIVQPPAADGATPTLRLIDFAFAVSIVRDQISDVEATPRMLRYLGGEFRRAPFAWNDAYSFLRIAQLIEPRKDALREEFELLDVLVDTVKTIRMQSGSHPQ